LCLLLSKLNLQCADTGPEGSLANNSLSEFIEINEKFLESDSVLGDQSLDTLLDILFNLKSARLTLIVARVTSPAGAHSLDNVAEGCSGFHFI
jgi:hypothetical protein